MEVEIHSVRRDWSQSVPSWYILYRTEPGMWESLNVQAETVEAAVARLKEVLSWTRRS